MKLALLVVSLTAIAGPALASSGQEGKGGDASLIRRAVIENFIQNDLKGTSIRYLKQLQTASISDPSLQKIFADLLGRGVIADIKNSPYKIEKSCTDSMGIKRSAVANDQELDGPVCFDSERLAQQGATQAELIGLAIHEAAHHFHYDDSDAKIAAFVAKEIESSPDLERQILPGSIDPNVIGNVCIATLMQARASGLPGKILGSAQISASLGVTRSDFAKLADLSATSSAKNRAIIISGVISGDGYFRFAIKEVDEDETGFVSLGNPKTLLSERVLAELYQEVVPSTVYSYGNYQISLSCNLIRKH